MAAIVIRISLVYIFLIISMRIMGKRQLGEMQVSELVTTLLFSELAVIPVYDQNIPIVFALVPVLLLLSFEIILSFLSSRSFLAKRIIEGVPSVLIHRGVLRVDELKRIRISLDELLGELRLKNITDIGEIEYAILEQNGRLSVIPKAAKKPATAENVGVNVEENGLFHPIIIDGIVNKSNLNIIKKNRGWLNLQMQKKKLSIKDVYLFSVDDFGKQTIIEKQKQEKP